MAEVGITNREQLKHHLMEDLMLLFRCEDGLKRYVDSNEVFPKDSFCTKPNVFGVYQNMDGLYVGFVTDAKKGDLLHNAEFDEECGACQWLYDLVHHYYD